MYSIQLARGEDSQLINVESDDMEIAATGDALFRDKEGFILCCFNSQIWMSCYKVDPKTEEPIGVTIFDDSDIGEEGSDDFVNQDGAAPLDDLGESEDFQEL